MSKYRNPFSVDKRNTVFINSNDPRVQGWKEAKTQSTMGREIKVVDSTSEEISLTKYVATVPNFYWISDMYKEALLGSYDRSGAWFASLTKNSSNIYNWGSSRRTKASIEKVYGIFSSYDKYRTVLSKKKFYIDDANTSMFTYNVDLTSDSKNICSGVIGIIGSTSTFTSSKAYVAKYESNMSSVIWANSITAPSSYEIVTTFPTVTTSSVTDASDNVYIAGTRKEVVSGFPGSFRNIMFVVKYNSSGVLQWQKRINALNNFHGLNTTDIKIDLSGNLYLLSYNDFGSSSKPLLIKFNSLDGSIIWQKTYAVGSSFGYQTRSMVIDSDGNIYIDVIFITGSTNTPGEHLIKIDTLGNVLWSRIIPNIASDSTNLGLINNNGTSLKIDSEGNIYWIISVYTSYILKISPSNVILWSNKLGGDLVIQDISINSDNDLYLSGAKAVLQSSDFPITIKLPSDGSLIGATYTVPGIPGYPSTAYSLTYSAFTFTSPSQTYVPTTATAVLAIGDMTSASLSIAVTDLTYLEKGVTIP